MWEEYVRGRKGGRRYGKEEYVRGRKGGRRYGSDGRCGREGEDMRGRRKNGGKMGKRCWYQNIYVIEHTPPPQS